MGMIIGFFAQGVDFQKGIHKRSTEPHHYIKNMMDYATSRFVEEIGDKK